MPTQTTRHAHLRRRHLTAAATLGALAVAAGCSGAPGTESEDLATTSSALTGGVETHGESTKPSAPSAATTTTGDTYGTKYGGGPLINDVRLAAVFWGPNVNATVKSKIPSFYTALARSPFIDMLNEYAATGGGPIGRGSNLGTWTITPSISGNVVDSQVADELARQINAGVLPVPDTNTLFMVHFPPNLTISYPTSQGTQVSCVDFCAYHYDATRTINGASKRFMYAIIPDFGGACSTCGDRSMLDNLTKTASHEIAEAITDPVPNSGWTPEIGDSCNYSSIGDASYAPLLGPGGFVIQKEWSRDANGCIWKGAMTDFIGKDHKSDIALVGAPGWTSVPIASSNGDGTFTAKNYSSLASTSQWTLSTFLTWASQSGVKVLGGNFSGEGRGDIALAGYGGWKTIPTAMWWAPGGDGYFYIQNGPLPTWFTTIATASGAQPVVGDFDGDGRDDVAIVGGAGATTIPIALSTGSGVYNTTNHTVATFPALAATAGVQAVPGDFNGDGRSDIALVGPASWTSIPIAFSTGTGSFTVTNVSVANFPGWASALNVKPIAGDFDGDGKGDIALTGFPTWFTMPVAFSNGDGSFRVTNQPITNFALWGSLAGAKPVSGDFDGDGVSDIALTGGSGWSTVPVAFSNRDGTFRVTDATNTTFATQAATAGAVPAGGH